MKVLAPVPQFVGFVKADGTTLDPGKYAAVIDFDGIVRDETTGDWRIPYIYDPNQDPETAKVTVRIGA